MGASVLFRHQFRHQYEELLVRLLRREVVEANQRTGREVSVLPQPVLLNVDLSDGTLPRCGVRKTWPVTAAAEVAWFLSGSQDSTFVRGYAPIWDKFVEEDGVTVLRAYGYRWRRHFGRDQIADAVRALRVDPTSRRVYVDAWDAGDDGLDRTGQLNVPCPVGFNLTVVGGRLCSTLVLRSSDVFVGLPYDVMGHALLLDSVGAELGLPLGCASFCLMHPHMYGVHYGMAEAALGGLPCSDSAPMPGWSVSRITEDPHGYVATVREAFRRVRQPKYQCRPEVVV